ncbi:uncharacterized protein RJT20DRAFT_133850 [Scheffersomyces xylosifermentans]|uniref:uncharacterized protein n=1 Tax=Scheffersomyces xylosifermentans TaxID=1304137 RepID=UPI00315CCB4B
MISTAPLAALLVLPVVNAFVSNIEPVNKASNGLGEFSMKAPADLSFSGNYVCDKYSSIIQSTNSTTNFPIDFNMYVANDEGAPNENYTVDLYFKNPNSFNSFRLLNASSKEVLTQYNPTLVSAQPNFGTEFKFSFSKGLLCQFLYQFTVAYQLENTNSTRASDKIFLVGSCQENQRYHSDTYNYWIGKGFRCVEYNSGFKYDGGKDWCSKFYPSDQCCTSYINDEVSDRDNCPIGSSSENLVPPSTSLVQGTTTCLTPIGNTDEPVVPQSSSEQSVSFLTSLGEPVFTLYDPTTLTTQRHTILGGGPIY